MRMTLLIPLLFLLTGVSVHATAQHPKKGSVVIRLVGKDLVNAKSPRVLHTIQLGSTGQFLSIDGSRLPEKNLKSVFIIEKDKNSETYSELVVDIVNCQQTSLQTLLRAIELLKQAAPAGVATTIYLRTGDH